MEKGCSKPKISVQLREDMAFGFIVEVKVLATFKYSFNKCQLSQIKVIFSNGRSRSIIQASGFDASSLSLQF